VKLSIKLIVLQIQPIIIYKILRIRRYDLILFNIMFSIPILIKDQQKKNFHLSILMNVAYQ